MFYSCVFLRIKLSHIFLSLFIIFTLALSPSNSSEIIYENIIDRFWLDIILFENKSALYLLTINIKTILENKTPENTTYIYNIDDCDIYNTQWKKQRLNNSKNETIIYIQKTSCFQTKNSYTKLRGFYIFKKYLYFRYKIKNFRMRVFLPKNAYIPENISLENIGDIGYNRSYLPFYQPLLYSTGERLYTVLTSEIPRYSVIPLEIRFHIKENSYISIFYFTIFTLLILSILFIIYIKLKPRLETKKILKRPPPHPSGNIGHWMKKSRKLSISS